LYEDMGKVLGRYYEINEDHDDDSETEENSWG
jgi:hypothetical protein